jgi:hypothetical protein
VPAAALQQRVQALLGGVEDAVEVDLDGLVPGVLVELGEGHHVEHAGVVHEQVERAAGELDGAVGGGLDRAVVAHVHLRRQALTAGLVDLGHHRVELDGVARRDDDLRALAREAQGDGTADASAAAGDQDGGCVHALRWGIGLADRAEHGTRPALGSDRAGP